MRPSIQVPTVSLVAVLVFGAATWLACDDGGPTPPPPPTNVFKNLNQRGDVLTNIEAAYNQRRIEKYDEALDPNFTFFLWPGDVGGGLPDQWDRAEDVKVNQRLFDKSYAALPCQKIQMDFRTEEGVTWTGFTPPAAPTETWYSTTLYYEFRFEINPDMYISMPGAKLAFTVRDAGPHGSYEHHWQLVEMRDLGYGTLRATSSSTEASTLGKIKALYR